MAIDVKNSVFILSNTSAENVNQHVSIYPFSSIFWNFPFYSQPLWVHHFWLYASLNSHCASVSSWPRSLSIKASVSWKKTKNIVLQIGNIPKVSSLVNYNKQCIGIFRLGKLVKKVKTKMFRLQNKNVIILICRLYKLL